ncbi:hypothetical protein Tco_1071950, partial [Tanacetum coccineum]
MANCRFRLLMLACHLLWLQPWRETYTKTTEFVVRFVTLFSIAVIDLYVKLLSELLARLPVWNYYINSGKWKDGRERESLASATSTGAPMAGIDMNGFDKDEIVRFLARQLSTVAAMADSANIEQLNIQEERHVNEPEPDVPP